VLASIFTKLVRFFFCFLEIQTIPPKLMPIRIEPKTLREANFKVPKQNRHINQSGFKWDLLFY